MWPEKVYRRWDKGSADKKSEIIFLGNTSDTYITEGADAVGD